MQRLMYITVHASGESSKSYLKLYQLAPVVILDMWNIANQKIYRPTLSFCSHGLFTFACDNQYKVYNLYGLNELKNAVQRYKLVK